MTIISVARIFIVLSSFLLLLSCLMFFLLGPALGFQLDHDQAYATAKQVAPLFIGYLAQSTYYLTRKGRATARIYSREQNFLLVLLVVCPFLIFWSVALGLIYAFYTSNRAGTPPGTGMSYDVFSNWFSLFLSLFTATTTVLTAWVFARAGEDT